MPSHPPRGSPTRDNGCHAPREKAGPPERPPGHTAVSAPPRSLRHRGRAAGVPARPPPSFPALPSRCSAGQRRQPPATGSRLRPGGGGGKDGTGRDATREGAETAAAPRPSAKGRRGGATGPSPPPPRHTERPPVPRPAASPLRGGRASRSAPPRPGPAALRLPRPGERGARPSR